MSISLLRATDTSIETRWPGTLVDFVLRLLFRCRIVRRDPVVCGYCQGSQEPRLPWRQALHLAKICDSTAMI